MVGFNRGRSADASLRASAATKGGRARGSRRGAVGKPHPADRAAAGGPKRKCSWEQWTAQALRVSPITSTHVLGNQPKMKPKPPRPHFAVSDEEAARASLADQCPVASAVRQRALLAGQVGAPQALYGDIVQVAGSES